jgi:hypothetical protein
MDTNSLDPQKAVDAEEHIPYMKHRLSAGSIKSVELLLRLPPGHGQRRGLHETCSRGFDRAVLADCDGRAGTFTDEQSDEAEDNGAFGDGPIGFFLLSPFAKGGGKTSYTNFIHYDHSSTLKTLQEIFGVTPLLGAAGDEGTNDLGDFFK